jgi:hypothetical protein
MRRRHGAAKAAEKIGFNTLLIEPRGSVVLAPVAPMS